MIYGDSEWFDSIDRQVVSILLDNAAKYCDEKGKVAVRLSSGEIRAKVLEHDRVMFEVILTQ